MGSLMGCRPELGFALVLVVGMVIHKVGSLHRMCLHPSKVEIMASWLNEGIQCEYDIVHTLQQKTLYTTAQDALHQTKWYQKSKLFCYCRTFMST